MLTTQTGTKTRIVEVNFTFALMGGMWLKDEFGQVAWVSDAQGLKEYPDTWERWHRVAYHDGWCGMWYATPA